ncbi:MAG: TAXI family TRAP transporter solute-binding subunit [Chlamydiota bacterium]
MKKLLSYACLVFGSALIMTACSEKESEGKEKKPLTIGTGSQLGVYYSAGLAIADLVNDKEGDPGLVVEATEGGAYNIDGITEGNLDFGFTQADLQYQAAKGLGPWKGRPQKKLSFICSFHPEVVAVVAYQGSNIKHIRDLRYKTVNIGQPGSGTRFNAIDVLHTIGIDEKHDITAKQKAPAAAVDMLHDHQIDAFFLTSAQPNNILSDAVSEGHEVYFVPITGVKKILQDFPYYTKARIPINYYPEATNRKDVESIGILTTLVASSDLSVDKVYMITKTLFENLAEFKTKHPSFISLTPEEMVKGSLVPIHPGAEKYFREKGLLSK